MKMSTRLHIVALGIVLGGVLAGCTASGESEDTAPDSPAASTAEAESNGGDVDPDASGATDAGIDLDNPPKAIAAVEVPIQADLYGRNVDSSLLEVVHMRHVEDALIVTFRVTITGDSTTDETLRLWDAVGGNFAPALIDYKNLLRYNHVQGLSTTPEILSPPGEPLYAVATFAYPEDADVVDIIVNDAIPAIPDVPVP